MLTFCFKEILGCLSVRMSDIEPTQALAFSDYDNETDDEQTDTDDKPVSFVTKSKIDVSEHEQALRVDIMFHDRFFGSDASRAWSCDILTKYLVCPIFLQL